MKSTEKKLAECLKCKYPVEVVECEDGCYFVRLPDLPGCMSQGDTVEEALKNIEEARELWLEGAIESGMQIPKPARRTAPSSKVETTKARSSGRSSDKAKAGKKRTQRRR